MSTPLPIDETLAFGHTIVVTSAESARRTAEGAEAHGFDSVWAGDHVVFTIPIYDPFLTLSQVAAHSSTLTIGTAVYLLPLRHPVAVAKQVATLDVLSGGRFVFGVGVGGEFPKEFEAVGVPVNERGARLSEAIPLMRRLWSGEPTSSAGPLYPIPEIVMKPVPAQPKGPPIWCGGRSEAALRRIGRMADGWMSYVVTPEHYRRGLETIAKAAESEKRSIERFDTSHFIFLRMEDRFETALDVAGADLSKRYAMDFRPATKKYAALGRAEEVAATIDQFRDAGVRHLIVDPVGPVKERDAQLARFAREVIPLLRSSP